MLKANQPSSPRDSRSSTGKSGVPAESVKGIEDKSSVIPASDEELEQYFEGCAIFGDGFSPDQISRWFADETEAYADLGAKDHGSYRYRYHSMNSVHGYGRLPSQRRFRRALGFGSAYGDELVPVLDRVDSVTIVDPSDSFVQSKLHGKPVEWVKPDPSGTLPFDDGTFDLITCFGVLHHIPNVTHVLSEFGRVLSPGGMALVREPVVSMGDWRKPRRGLTSRERGLPLEPFKAAIERSGLRARSFRLIGFGPMLAVCGKLGYNPYNSTALTMLDWLLAESAKSNYRYHTRNEGIIQKVRPTAVFCVLERSAD